MKTELESFQTLLDFDVAGKQRKCRFEATIYCAFECNKFATTIVILIETLCQAPGGSVVLSYLDRRDVQLKKVSFYDKNYATRY